MQKKTVGRIRLNRETLLGLDGLTVVAAALNTAATCDTVNFSVCITNCARCAFSPRPCPP